MPELVLVEPGRKVGHIVDSNSGCWIWQGAIAANGYGRVGVPGHNTAQAHRFYWERLNGAVPKGFELDHLCRDRACVNPQHLEVVTRKVNARRGTKTKLTEPQVVEIRDMRRTGATFRAIGTKFGIHHTHAIDICRFRRWAE